MPNQAADQTGHQYPREVSIVLNKLVIGGKPNPEDGKSVRHKRLSSMKTKESSQHHELLSCSKSRRKTNFLTSHQKSPQKFHHRPRHFPHQNP